MCGFAGFLSSSNSISREHWPTILTNMGNAILHRAPDDGGVWFDGDRGVGLSHRRLSVLDLSEAGHQPMVSPSGRFVMAYNGEIYNHLTIRSELDLSIKWREHSDTEPMLAGFDIWGIDRTLKKSTGMFAMAVWDRHDHLLTLVRDRLGEKPLYYGWQGNNFFFGSELQALKIHPQSKAEIDRNAVGLFMRHNYIPAPYSIYRNIKKLLPGTYATISLEQPDPKLCYYWDAREIIKEGYARPFQGTESDAVDELERLLREAIGRQMISDVPLGAFLSGGIDSSTIVALMQAQASQAVKTFTIGFQETDYNEAEQAKAVAKHLGVDHTELYLTSIQASEVIPLVPSLFCEPFSDSSQIPPYLVSKLASQKVTVSLSGDGGDELFGGYTSYFKFSEINKKLSRIPIGVNSILPKVIKGCSQKFWNSLFAPIKALLQTRNIKDVGFKLHLAADMLKARSIFYRFLASHWQHPSDLVLHYSDYPTIFTETHLQPETATFYEKMMVIDLLSYLPDDILTKVDRAAKGVSLETRAPLLDHDVVEFAWSLPISYKVRQYIGKWPLRQVLCNYVPQELMERSKQGFSVPIDIWLRGSLREWSEELFDESRLKQEGYLNPRPIRKKWAEHLSGIRDWQYPLWDVLMFQAWLEA